MKLQLPVDKNIYAIQFKSDISSSLTVQCEQINNIDKENVICLQEVNENYSLASAQLISVNEINLKGGKMMITNGPTGMKSKCVSNIKTKLYFCTKYR